MTALTRRQALAGFAAGLARSPAAAGDREIGVRVRDDAPGHAISPYIYGDNELGDMDGGTPSAILAAGAGVTARRLGGNLMTTYNWVNNASNAGIDWHHDSGLILPGFLGLDARAAAEPHAVIDAAHRAARSIGAISLVTTPLAGHVAADTGGPVAPEDTAPARRWTPVSWRDDGRGPADAPALGEANIPHLLRRLVDRFGGAADAGGVRGYALDNEPALWSETHPRVVPKPVSIESFIERSLTAARAIRLIDPDAWIFGPVSWGATAFHNFHGAPDWRRWSAYGNFIALYLDAFRRESERVGERLLDALDIHWYAYHRRGDLYNVEDEGLSREVLDAPRALSEPGWREDSWVGDLLRSTARTGLSLPILPSMKGLIAKRFPGTALAVTEYNYGSGGALATGLALVDALGRFGAEGVLFASHWGALHGLRGEAWRLYRGAPDRDVFGAFGDRFVEAVSADPADLRSYAATDGGGRLDVILVNAGEAPVRVPVRLSGSVRYRRFAVAGFEAARPRTGRIAEAAAPEGGEIVVEMPGRSARRVTLTA